MLHAYEKKTNTQDASLANLLRNANRNINIIGREFNGGKMRERKERARAEPNY